MSFQPRLRQASVAKGWGCCRCRRLWVYREDGSTSYVSHDSLDHDYLLPTSPSSAQDDAPTTSAATTGIHEAYRRCEWTGAGYGEQVIVKTSTNHEAMQREVDNVALVQEHAEDDVVVDIYDHNLDESSEGTGNDRKDAVLVMERGEQDLLGYLNDNYQVDWENGEAIPNIVYSIVKSIEAMHSAGLVWTDAKLCKFLPNDGNNRGISLQQVSDINFCNTYIFMTFLANFVVIKPTPETTVLDGAEGDLVNVKAIDLESCAQKGNHPLKFTPSTCPPEMADVLMAYVDGKDGVPRHETNFSFDIWSLGVIVFTLLTKQSFHEHNLDFEYIARNLNTLEQHTVDQVIANVSLSPSARDFISTCLRVNPDERPNISDLLVHPFIVQEDAQCENFDAPAAVPEELQGDVANWQNFPPQQLHDHKEIRKTWQGIELEENHLASYEQQFEMYSSS